MAEVRASGRLRVLSYAWHVGHQYELFKLPCSFALFRNEHSLAWNEEVRPLPDSAHFVSQLRREDYDLAILPFDEHVLTPTYGNSHLPPDWGHNFAFLLAWCREQGLPAILLCHGTIPRLGRFRPELSGERAQAVDEPTLKALRGLVEEDFVICNSEQALAEWGFRGRGITHGFDPDEYPLGPRRGGVLTIGGNLYRNGVYQGFDLFEACAREVRIELLGRDVLFDAQPASALVERVRVPSPRMLPGSRLFRSGRQRFGRRKFELYKATIGERRIYLNTTRFSPMPRSRAEAMLCGLAIVSTPWHDFDRFVEHGRTGFLFEQAEDAIRLIRELEAHPTRAIEIGERGRRAAIEHFHIDRYLREWRDTIEHRLSAG